MRDTSSIERLRPNPHNPRTITPAKATALKKALKKFGDLGGVVLNRRTGMLVTGHQRTEAFHSSDTAKVDITLTYQNPSKTGTVAEGYVTIDGEKFAYREVDWDEKTAKAASIAANQNAGQFDMGGLTAWLNELNAEGFDMDFTMMEPQELMPYLPSMHDEPDVPPAYVAPDSDDFDPETGEVAGDSTGQTQTHTHQVQVHDTVSGQVKAVQLFFDVKAHAKFLECVEALQQIYNKDNLSDTVFEAIKRASVSEAVR